MSPPAFQTECFEGVAIFSRRFEWDLVENRLSRLIAEKRRAGVTILDLTESNPTRAGFVYPKDEILSAFTNDAMITYTPEPRGLSAARHAVADYYKECGISVSPDRIHLTSSTSEGYAFLFKLLADAGAAVLVPQPSYPLFEFLAALDCVELRPYNLVYRHPFGWRIGFESLEEAITENTRAVIVVNPNNPTGSFVTPEDRAHLSSLCARRGLAIIADEVFADYSWGDANTANRSLLLEGEALTFVLSGLSKVAGLPQMKLGWIAASGPAELCRTAQERLDLIADTYLSVSTPVQLAAPALLRLRRGVQSQIGERVGAHLAHLKTIVGDSPCRVLSGEAGWYAVLEIPRHFPEEEWVLKLLEDDNVLVHPGYFFNFEREAFLVLSLLPPSEVFALACRHLMARF